MFPGPPDGAVDRTGARSGNFRNQFTARGKTCESFCTRCPQEGWTPLWNRGKIVDTMGVLGLLAAAAVLSVLPPTLNPRRLPRLPVRGFALETRAGVELQTMRGRAL